MATFLVGQGAVGDPAAPTLRPMLAVVTAQDFVFLASEYDEDVRVEYARVPRTDIVSVDIVDGEGRPVSEDVLRPIDPSVDPLGTFVIAVDRTGPEDDDHRMGFAVRSAVVAGEIRDRLRRYVVPA